MADDQQEKAEQMEQLRYMYNMYLQKYEAILNDISMYSQAQVILQRNTELMDKLDMVKNTNTLVALEGGVYLDAKIADAKRVMVYVGGGYTLEKTPSEAKEFFMNSERAEKALLGKLNEEKLMTERELQNIVASLDSMK